MILKQYYLGCLSHASYLIGDEQSGTAVVVDPQRDVGQYLEDARQQGLSIRHVFLTHLHADFLAGHLELRDQAGAKIYLGAQAKAEYAFIPMKDGDVLEFGQLRLRVLETPGHTPESITILVYDTQRQDQVPYAALTGDTLFIGDVGRPDLRASLGWSAADLGSLLYSSLREKLLPLPDETLVYPAHGAGTLCGKNLSTDTVSTIGVQRRENYALQAMDKETFLRIVTADQPDAPDYFTYDAVLNSKERPTLEESLERSLKPLTLETVLRLQADGAQILDARDPSEFLGAYLAGSINIGLSGQYATWAGTLLNPEVPIVIIAGPESEKEAAMRLGRIGFDNVVGFLEGGMQALQSSPDLVQQITRLSTAALAEQLASPKPPMLIDVRTEDEWGAKRIDGSLNIPLNRLAERLGEVPSGRPVVVHCAGGYRSSIAASLLARHHAGSVADLAGGVAAWEAAGLGTLES